MTVELGPDRHIIGVNDESTLAALDLVTADGRVHPFWCVASELPGCSAFLLTLPQLVAANRGAVVPPPGEVVANAVPVSTLAWSLAPGPSPDEVLLVVHIGLDQPLVLAASPNVLGELHELLGRHLVRSVDAPKPN